MELSDKAEEILESLLLAIRDDPAAAVELCRLPEQDAPEAVEEVTAAGLAVRRGDALALTPAGRVEATGVLRRHRLAERLLVDVLDVGEELVHQAACRFEHIIHKGIDDRICTLLGHPKFCPHGSPIPPGPCCLENRDIAGRVVAPLANLEPGASGRIAYIHTSQRPTLDRLIAMGALPGTDIRVIQTTPSYVFQVGQTQVAVDRQIAEHIYVRLEPQAPARRRARFRLRDRPRR
jgi:DtxR family Mn-dependent transcriptional regulator